MAEKQRELIDTQPLFEGGDNPTQQPTVEQLETFDDRFYRVTTMDESGEAAERYYPSVTTILGAVQVGDAFGQWKQEQSARLGVEGARLDLMLRAEHGTTVHAAIGRYNKGETLYWTNERGEKQYTDFEWGCIVRYRQWLRSLREETEADVRVVATEHTVYHDSGFAGTLDALISVDGEIYAVDYKTSKQITDIHLIQVAAYVMAARQMYPSLNIVGGAVLALNTRHKAGYGWKSVIEDDLEHHYNRFLSRLRLFQLEHPTFEPSTQLLDAVLEPEHMTSYEFDIHGG